jgi:hypothetical protein
MMSLFDPASFRRDVVAVAQCEEAPLSQIVEAFGTTDASLHGWLNRTHIKNGGQLGLSQKDSRRLRAAKAAPVQDSLAVLPNFVFLVAGAVSLAG